MHVALDADDTLWHNESIFAVTQERFRAMLTAYVPAADVDARLLAVERRNMRLFGYGIKAFTLSLIETAIEVTDGRVAAADVQEIIGWGKWMLEHPVELLPGVRDVVVALAGRYDLMLVTKGDLFHQESKLARSGIADRFARVEIVSEKNETVYRRILARHGIAPERFVMVGDSVRSDVLPVLALGGHAVHVPPAKVWAHEAAEVEAHDRLRVIGSLPELPPVLEEIASAIGG